MMGMMSSTVTRIPPMTEARMPTYTIKVKAKAPYTIPGVP